MGVFSRKKKEQSFSLTDARIKLNERVGSVDEKIVRLDAQLLRYKEQLRRTRPRHFQEAIKARAMRLLKQKRMLEGRRDMLYIQIRKFDQVAFAVTGVEDAQQTMTALKSANKELRGVTKAVRVPDIESIEDERMDLIDVSNEIQQSLCRSVPDDIEEEELIDELDALEADMGAEIDSEGVPIYIEPDSPPLGHIVGPSTNNSQGNVLVGHLWESLRWRPVLEFLWGWCGSSSFFQNLTGVFVYLH